MEIFIFIILFLFLSLPALHFANRFLKNPHLADALSTILGGVKHSFRWFGFVTPGQKYPIELYQWQTMEDDEVCEDCLERSTWPPMDIADWMKEGLPGTAEAETQCGKNCRCELVIYKPKPSPVKF